MENLQVLLPGWETVRCIGSGSSGKVYELKKKDEYDRALKQSIEHEATKKYWEFAEKSYDVLEKVSVRIVNEVKNINRIVYDITSKPPATIEWE